MAAVTPYSVPLLCSHPHLSLEAAQGLHKEGGPAHVQHRRGAALLPFADAIVESQQVGKALRVLESRTLALGTLGKGKGGHSQTP